MDKRTEEAYLGKARHNLKNPVNAILGYSEMLIEDCEEENLDDPITDLKKLYQAGKDILNAIDTNFDEKALNDSGKTIAKIGKETEFAIRMPLNTIIGYSELLLEDNKDIPF